MIIGLVVFFCFVLKTYQLCDKTSKYWQQKSFQFCTCYLCIYIYRCITQAMSKTKRCWVANPVVSWQVNVMMNQFSPQSHTQFLISPFLTGKTFKTGHRNSGWRGSSRLVQKLVLHFSFLALWVPGLQRKK